jgi:hypothetical protein
MAWGTPGRVTMLHDWESSYKIVPSAASAYKLPFIDEGLGVDDPPIETSILGTANPSQPARGNKDAKGQIIVPLDLDAIGFWLKGALGAPGTTGSASPYTHIFKYAAGALPSAVIDMGSADLTLYYKFLGCMVNTLAFSFGGNGPLQATIGLLCGSEIKGTSAYHASPTGDYSNDYTLLNNPDISAMAEGGSPITTIEQFNLTLDNQLDSTFGLAGSGWRTNCQRTKMKVTGNIVATFEDDSLLLKGRGNTESSLQVTITSGIYSLVFKVPELKYSQRRPGTKGPAGLRQDLSFVGYYTNDEDATGLKVTLVNTRAAAVYA